MPLLHSIGNYYGEGHLTGIAWEQNKQSHMNIKKPGSFSRNMNLFECRLSNNRIKYADNSNNLKKKII